MDGVDDTLRPRLVYLVAADRADELLGPLHSHFASAPEVAVMVERRGHDRDQPAPPNRVQRRAPVAERDAARMVPPGLRRDAAHVRLVQPMQPVRRVHEATDMQELVRLSIATEPAAVSELWWRVGERVRTRLRLQVGAYAVDRLTSQMLGRILDELPGYDPRQLPLASWLDQVVDRYAIDLSANGDLAA
jgi:hypothetical protein